MAKPYKFLRVSTTVFKVLAWVAVAFQVVTGTILIVTGGEPVAIGNLELPVRVVGLLNFIAAGLYFFSFWLMKSVLQLLLDIRERQPGS